jgi:rhomboid protease GluP
MIGPWLWQGATPLAKRRPIAYPRGQMASTKGKPAMDPNTISPFNAMPRVVIGLAVVILGLEALFQAATFGFMGGAGGVGWRLDAIRDYAVFDEIATYMWTNGVMQPEQGIRLLSYPLIHTGMLHAGFVVVFVLAMGKMVAEVFSPWAFLAVFWGAAIAGGMGFVVFMDSPYPLVGGYPGVYGLIGAFTFLMWVEASARGGNRYRAFGLIGMLLAIQALFGVIEGQFGNVVADVTGFVAGFLLSFLLVPGGWRRFLARIRSR